MLHAVRRPRRPIWALLALSCWLLAEADGSRMQQCLKTLRNITFERCINSRSRRSPILDALDPAADFASTIEQSHTRKRQIMSIREIIVSSRVPMYDISYPFVPSYTRHESAPIVPPTYSDVYPTARRFESLPQESGSDLGFEMNYEELDELFEEMYGPTAHSPTKREFRVKAYECCKNEELCRTNKDVKLPCAQ